MSFTHQPAQVARHLIVARVVRPCTPLQFLERGDIIQRFAVPLRNRQPAAGMVGRTLEVLCEGHDKDRQEYFGRSWADAPDIDTKVYFAASAIPAAGQMVTIEITGADGYDIVGIGK